MKRVLRLSSATIACGVALLLAAPSSEAIVITYQASLDGPSESPPTPSDGTGLATVIYDSLAHTLAIAATWTDLESPTTVAHIHCCTAVPGSGNIGVAVTPTTLPGFPAGVTAGNYAVVIDLTDSASYTAAFVNNFGGGTIGGAEAALIAGFDADRAYFNIHSQQFPSGEIRGFLAEVPEPLTAGLLALGLAGLGVFRRKPS